MIILAINLLFRCEVYQSIRFIIVSWTSVALFVISLGLIFTKFYGDIKYPSESPEQSRIVGSSDEISFIQPYIGIQDGNHYDNENGSRSQQRTS